MSKKENELSSRARETSSTSSDVVKVTEGMKDRCKITDSEKKGKGSKHKQTGNEEASGGDRTTQPSKAKGTGKERRETPSTTPDPDDPSNEEDEESQDSEDEDEHTDNEEASDGDYLTDGKWLQDHPWESERPDRLNSKMADTITMSKEYTVSEEWQRGKKHVDLGKIYSNLPKFVSEMKGLTSREELERLFDFRLYETLVLLNKVVSPHIKEIVQKKMGVQPKDKPSLQKQGEKFMAYSLSKHHAHQFQPSPKNYRYLDCEYMLKMYLPDDSLQWFEHKINEKETERIRKINADKGDFRWVFIPSFRRAKIALLDWPEDNEDNKIITRESTLRILVVRPSEFKEYVQCCGNKFPVISLPQDEIGAGYPRFWIQKIALRLELDFIWMIDDSVKYFYEIHPTQTPHKNSYKKYRRRPFGSVFERIEKLVKEEQDDQPPIAAMSPNRFRGGHASVPFVCSPPKIAVFLNIKALKSKESILSTRASSNGRHDLWI